jgi:outer membrane protein OmpA-like peptidoglycan-associated protein
MLSKAQKSRATAKEPRTTCGPIAQRKTRAGAGNRHRAHETGVPRFLQRKLAIGKANDHFEQEADRVAGEVMRSPKTNAGSLKGADQTVQRTCACGGGCNNCKKKRLSLKRQSANSHEAVESPASVDRVLHSSGQPLDTTTRAFMEPRFGYDFGNVRLHTDSAAARSARDVNALAFTVGNHIAFGAGQYVSGSAQSNRLLAHELAHVVQQGGAESGPQVSNVIQRAGDPAAIPFGFPCDTDLTPGAPSGTDLLFARDQSAIVPASHDVQLTAFVAAWVASGGTDEILIHGYSSTAGDQGFNWTLSCDRAQNVREELVRRGIPRVHIAIVAHGESTDFGASAAANQHAVISTSAAGLLSTPLILLFLTPGDNFAGRSRTRFGVGESIDLSFMSIPSRPAADFGGLQWRIGSGGGTLTGVTVTGFGTYDAPATADTVRLELTIASGVNAGRVVGSRTISIVEPSAVRMVAVAGSAPGFNGTIPAGRVGAGFQADVFVDPRDVSFQGVVFGEGTVTAVVTPTGSYQSSRHGTLHGANTFGPGHGGNATTGTPVSPPVDNIRSIRGGSTGTLAGLPTCGAGGAGLSDFLWAIPWEFSVAGGARTRFPGGFTANHHFVVTMFCDGIIEKAGAGPFCRRIDGTTC